MNFHEARGHVRKLGLKTGLDYREWAKTTQRPKNIPTNPWEVYKEDGWVSMSDWLGYDSRKDKVLESLKNVFERSKKRGYLPRPNANNSTSQEKKDASLIKRIKNAKIGKGKNTWYPEFGQMAKEYGFSNVFD